MKLDKIDKLKEKLDSLKKRKQDLEEEYDKILKELLEKSSPLPGPLSSPEATQ